MNNQENASWKVSEDVAASRGPEHDLFTKGIDYVSTTDIHWDKIEVHDLTVEGATRFAEEIVKALNRAEGI